MSSPAELPQRLHRILGDVAERLKLRGADPALDLAGRFGVRRFVERHVSGGAELPPSPWLAEGAHMRKEARRVSRALTEAGVRHCFFKGIALIGRFYRIDERQLADIDLLVDIGQFTDAFTALHGLGYGEFGSQEAWAPAARRAGVTMQRGGGGAGAPRGSVLLDVHWGLEPAETVLTDEELVLPPTVWPRVESEHGIAILPDELHAALVLHHLVRHDLLHVRGLVDFALLWNALPRDAGHELSELAGVLGVERALRVIGRVMVDELHLYPLRGVRLGPVGWRDRLAINQLRLRPLLAWAARNASDEARHVKVTRSLVWRRFALADTPHAGRLLRDLLAPPREYLAWRWPNLSSGAMAWRRHLASAFRQ
jgi:hypothetical protein